MNTVSESCASNGQIRQFYAGKRILLSGCTGFIGSGILEKLLRTCPEIDMIYLMIKPKKNKTVEERLKEYFQENTFDVMRQKNPKFMERIAPIASDLMKVDLGLSPEDRQHLRENVDIIIHNGAQVSFNARISVTLRSNVLGTKYMIDLASECAHLKVFMYVSTAYSHCYNKEIEEVFYPCPVDLQVIEDIIRAEEEVPNGISESVLLKMLGNWVNVYTFSKSVAEELVRNFSGKTSALCAVYRPSIVISSLEEPFPGWIVSSNGLALFFIGMNMGLLHTAPFYSESVLDIVPADMAVNSLLASIWDLSVNKKTIEPQVYNYGSSFWKPFNLKAHHSAYFARLREYPCDNAIWHPFIVYAENLYSFLFLHLLFHIIPAALYDLVCLALRREPKALAITMKVTKFTKQMIYFANNNWVIKADNVQNILRHMNAADHNEFRFDLAKWDVAKSGDRYLMGLKLYVLKESLDEISAARRRYQILRIAHYTLTAFLIFSIAYLLYRTICNCCC